MPTPGAGKLKPHWLLPEQPFASYADYLAQFDGKSPAVEARKLSPEAILEQVKKSGLRGRGGAGFPSGLKWTTIMSNPCKTRSVICNAAEGEPGTFKDRYLLRKNPYAGIEGMVIAAQTIGADRIYIAIKKRFEREVGQLRRAIEEMSAAGTLGGTRVDVVLGPDAYLFGEEKALINVVDGGPPMPREAHYPPYERGLDSSVAFPNPSLVSNLETFARVPGIVSWGADSFRKVATASTPGTLMYTVCGDVPAPGLYEREAGITLAELFAQAGGPLKGRAFKAMLPGVSARVVRAADFGARADFDGLKALGSGVGSSGFIVFDDSRNMAQVARIMTRFLFVESCSQCISCKVGLGMTSEALDDLCAGRPGTADPLTRAMEAVVRAPTNNRCALPMGAALIVPSLVKAFPDDFKPGAPDGASWLLPKLVDYDEKARAFTYDEHAALKQPDWTYSDETAPAQA